jgi:glycosyltransferase involved in cell wall biosynthesis
MATKVLHVITSLARGGAETMLYMLLQALADDPRYEHQVVCLTPGNDFDFQRLAIPVRSLNMTPGLVSLLSIFSLKRLFSELKPDLIHSWMYHANVVALAAPSDTPIIWAIHHALQDISNEKRLTGAIIRGGRFLSHKRSIQKIIYCSQASQLQHEEIGYPKKKSVCIPNGFDCSRFFPLQDARRIINCKYGFSDNDKLIGLAARFHPIKNHIGMMEAFSLVADKLPNARLLLCGARIDNDNKELCGKLRQLNLTNKVRLVGIQDDMPLLFSALDVNVLCSLSESFPNVLGEAMACGVQCVSTDVGDATLIIGETGRVVHVGDNQALSEAIIEILNQSQEKREEGRCQARNRIQTYFSLPAIAVRYSNLYEEVLRSI